MELARQGVIQIETAPAIGHITGADKIVTGIVGPKTISVASTVQSVSEQRMIGQVVSESSGPAA